jgi:hypothetical protein
VAHWELLLNDSGTGDANRSDVTKKRESANYRVNRWYRAPPSAPPEVGCTIDASSKKAAEERVSLEVSLSSIYASVSLSGKGLLFQS